MRALAVAMVVMYHLYPHVLSGGYVGVDVFFVISGFLITGHLASRFAKTGRVRMLEFYGRRARRLLPAAVLVLVVTWITGRMLLPATEQPAAANQVRASALYIENWVLAHDSVNYLAAQQAPSPVQHYWSLSVEEQFYLIWPLLFVAAVAAAVVATRRGVRASARRTGLRVATALAFLIVTGSLWYSVHETATNRAAAYFVTPTRLWELGLGGALALLYPTVSRLVGRAGLLGWAGLAMVVGAAVGLSGSSAFPGWIAVIPTIGTVLLIASGSAGARFSPAVVFARRPVVFIGDISYGVYLWHWPLIVLWLAYSGGSIGVLDGPVIAATSVLLAWLTKRVVEDPIRRARWVAPYPGRSLATATAAVLPVALTTAFLLQQPALGTAHADAAHSGASVLASAAARRQTTASRVPQGTRPGAPAPTSSPAVSASEGSAPPVAPTSSQAPLRPPPVAARRSPSPGSSVPQSASRTTSSPSARRTPSESIATAVPPVAQAPQDMPLANQNRCKAQIDASRVVSCTVGDTTHPRLTVALVGDSFAAEWSSALAQIGTKQHWKVVTVTHDGCPFTATLLTWQDKPYQVCHQWGRSALDYLLHTVHPNVVITSFLPGHGVASHPTFDATARHAIAAGMETYWRALAASGAYVVGIKPSPDMRIDVPDCLSSRTGTIATCSVPRSKALFATSAIAEAVHAVGPATATEIDLDNYICGATECKPIVGNVVVYRDRHHLTKTYSMTLAPFLRRALLKIPALRG